MKNCLVIVAFLFIGCSQKKETGPAQRFYSINIPDSLTRPDDTLLALINGVWFYRKHAFSGHIQTYYISGKIKNDRSVYGGLEEGSTRSYYENGQKEAERYYRSGEKEGVHTGWWPNGNKRFEYHFKMGAYHGSFKEWYSSGKPLKDISYLDGKEQYGKGWRENGKPYMSFVIRDGRLYGSVNPNLCYSLKNEKGEFRNSP